MESAAGRRRFVWGGLVILLGAMSVLQVLVGLNAWAWALVLTAGGLGVFAVYLTDRSDWGWLIPTYVLWVAAGLIALTELGILQDETLGGYVSLAVSIPFIVIHALKPTQTDALIIGLIAGAIGTVLILAQVTPGHAAAGVVLLGTIWITVRQLTN